MKEIENIEPKDKNYKIKPDQKVELIKKLCECSGHTGIAGGQFLDLSYEKKKNRKFKYYKYAKKEDGQII